MVTISGRTLLHNEALWEFEYPLANAFEMKERIIILYNPDAYTSKFGQFKNLFAVTVNGEPVWTAELPTTVSGDRFYKVASWEPLLVYSFSSYECQIDVETGKIKARTFYK